MMDEAGLIFVIAMAALGAVVVIGIVVDMVQRCKDGIQKRRR